MNVTGYSWWWSLKCAVTITICHRYHYHFTRVFFYSVGSTVSISNPHWTQFLYRSNHQMMVYIDCFLYLSTSYLFTKNHAQLTLLLWTWLKPHCLLVLYYAYWDSHDNPNKHGLPTNAAAMYKRFNIVHMNIGMCPYKKDIHGYRATICTDTHAQSLQIQLQHLHSFLAMEKVWLILSHLVTWYCNNHVE